MSLISRVFYKELLWSILAVLLGFLILFVTIDGLSEANEIGKKDYTFLTLVRVIAHKIPEYTYQLLPICALIGAVLAFSNMSARSEMVVWRVSGMSLSRLIRMVIGLGLVLAVALWLLGDVGIARAQRSAKDIEDKALQRNSFFKDDAGYWSKQNLPSGAFRMINVRNIKDSNILDRVNLYELTTDFTLTRLIEAQSATEQSKAGVWVLRDVRVLDVESDEQGLLKNSKESHVETMEVDLAENSLNVMRTFDERNTGLSINELKHRVKNLKATEQNARPYEVAYWQKIFYPFGVIVMLLLALPFAFMQTRKGGVGVRVLAGIMFGLLFFVLTVMTQALSGLLKMSPVLLAIAPVALFFLIAVAWIYRVARA